MAGAKNSQRARHFLIGPGARESAGARAVSPTGLRERMLRSLAACYPNFFYLGGLAAADGGFPTAPCAHSPWWLLALLLLPASQARCHHDEPAGQSRRSRRAPCRAWIFRTASRRIAARFVVVPTLLLSHDEVDKLLERLEIHYLANRDPNLFFALLTDFPDSTRPQATTPARCRRCRRRHPASERALRQRP